MSTYYLSSLATGSGTGSSSSRWTLAQAMSNANSGDVGLMASDGNYDVGSQLTPTNRLWTLKAETLTRPVIRPSASIAAIINTANGNGLIYQGLSFLANGFAGVVAIAANGNSQNTQIDDCTFADFTNPTAVDGGAMTRCGVDLPSNSSAWNGGNTFNRGLSITSSRIAAPYGVHFGSTAVGFTAFSDNLFQSDASTSNGNGFRAADITLPYRLPVRNSIFTRRIGQSGVSQYFAHVRGGGSSGSVVYDTVVFENCLICHFGTLVVNVTGSATLPNVIFRRCAFYDVASRGVAGHQEIGCIDLAANPFADEANGDYNLTDTARDALTTMDITYPGATSTTLRNRYALAQSSTPLAAAGILLTGR